MADCLFTLNPWHLVRKWVSGGDLLFPLLVFSSPRLVTCFRSFLLCLPLNSDTKHSAWDTEPAWDAAHFHSPCPASPHWLVSSTRFAVASVSLTYIPQAQTAFSTSKIVLTPLFCLVEACLAAVVQFVEPYTLKNCSTNEAAFSFSLRLYSDIIYMHHCVRLRWTV